MKQFSTIVVAVLMLSTLIAVAQNQPPMPKPAPEVKNLAYFVGNWNTKGDLKPGPMGPGGKFTGVDRIEWMPGGFFLVAHTSGSSFMGKWTGLAVYGYDANKKAYTYDEFNSNGEVVHATGTFDGKVWAWSSDLTMGGNTVKTHFILTETSPTAYTYKFEMSQDGNNWATVMDGGGSKIARAAAAKKKK